MSSIVHKICDLCGEKIEPKETYITVRGNGVDAHSKCFGVLEPEEVVWFLGNEDVEYLHENDTRGPRVRVAVVPDTIKLRIGFVPATFPTEATA